MRREDLIHGLPSHQAHGIGRVIDYRTETVPTNILEFQNLMSSQKVVAARVMSAIEDIAYCRMHITGLSKPNSEFGKSQIRQIRLISRARYYCT